MAWQNPNAPTLFSGELELEQFGFPVPLFSGEQEMAWAHELLQVGNEAELEQFLGGLVDAAKSAYGTARSAIGAAIGSPTGQAIAGALKDVASDVLKNRGPIVDAVRSSAEQLGSGLGQRFGPIGAAVGGKVLGAAGAWAANKAMDYGQAALAPPLVAKAGLAQAAARMAENVRKTTQGRPRQSGSPGKPGSKPAPAAKTVSGTLSGHFRGQFIPDQPMQDELAAAREFVRVAEEVASATFAAAPWENLHAVARQAVRQANRRLEAQRFGGRWVRRGNRITLFGV